MASKREDFIVRNRAIDGVSKVVKKITGNFRRLGASIDRAAKRIQKFKLKFESALKTMRKAGRGMKSVGKSLTRNLSLPLIGVGAIITRTAFKFGKSMNRLKSLSLDATLKVSKRFVELEDKAKMLGATTAFSASEVGDAMVFLKQAGFTLQETLDSVADTLNLAAAGNLDLAEAADIASNIMGAFNIEAKEMGRVSDVLAATAANSNTNVTQLGEAMKEAAPIAKVAGISFEETAAAIGVLGNVGIQGTKAGTTLKAIFTKLAAPSARASKIMKAWNVTVLDSSGKFKTLENILAQIQPRIRDLNQQQQLDVINELFGLRGIAGGAELLVKALDKSEKGFGGLTKKVTESKGVAKAMADIMNSGFPGALKKFQSAFEGAAIAIAESGMIELFTDLLKTTTKFFTKVSKASPGLLKFATIMGGFLIVLGPLLIVLGSLVTMAATLAPLIAGLGIGMLALSGFVALAIFAFAAFVAWGVTIVEVWDDLPLFFEDLWSGIKTTFMDGVRFVLGVLAKIPGMSSLIGQAGLALLGDEKTPDEQERDAIEKQKKKLLEIVNKDKSKTTVTIDLNGAPKGTRSSVESSGPGKVQLNTGKVGGFQ